MLALHLPAKASSARFTNFILRTRGEAACDTDLGLFVIFFFFFTVTGLDDHMQVKEKLLPGSL